jgi:hypothetical protein
LIKVILRLPWHDGGEASAAGGDFRAIQYSVPLFANFTTIRNETVEIQSTSYSSVKVIFGNQLGAGLSHLHENKEKVTVNAGVTSPINVAYYHGVGEARIEVTITRQLADDCVSIQAAAAHAD